MHADAIYTLVKNYRVVIHLGQSALNARRGHVGQIQLEIVDCRIGADPNGGVEEGDALVFGIIKLVAVFIVCGDKAVPVHLHVLDGVATTAVGAGKIVGLLLLGVDRVLDLVQANESIEDWFVGTQIGDCAVNPGGVDGRPGTENEFEVLNGITLGEVLDAIAEVEGVGRAISEVFLKVQ